MKVGRSRLPAILSLLIVLGVLAASCGSSSGGTGVGAAAPDFTLPTVEGKTISLSDFQGQPVLVNFWATWCGPCRYEMPFLQSVHEQAQAQGQGQGLVVLAVSMGEGATTVSKFMNELGLTLTVLLDERQNVASGYKVNALPTSFFIDRGGIIRFKKVGAFATEADLQSALKNIM